MFTSWQWLVYFNIPCLILNLLGIYLSAIMIHDRFKANLCWHFNASAMMLTIFEIIVNSWDVVSKYAHGT